MHTKVETKNSFREGIKKEHNAIMLNMFRKKKVQYVIGSEIKLPLICTIRSKDSWQKRSIL